MPTGRHGARIDREQIAPRRQHVAASAIGRAGRTRRDAFAGQRREQRVPLRVAAGAAAEHMQAVAELAFLEIADEAVDARDRFGRRGRRRKPKIVLDARCARLVADRGDKTLPPRRIESVGGRVFVEQLLEPDEILRDSACGKRRRQMADGDGADAPLGLRGLAGIVDDEGIDHGQIADQRLGPAGVR